MIDFYVGTFRSMGDITLNELKVQVIGAFNFIFHQNYVKFNVLVENWGDCKTQTHLASQYFYFVYRANHVGQVLFFASLDMIDVP